MPLPPARADIRREFILGLVLTLAGAAALAGAAGPANDYAYPIIWWGVLFLADAFNASRHRLSLWLTNVRHFVLVTAPVSVLVWLFFEALNLAAPQWAYHSRVREVWKLVPLGVVSFATVIPIVIQSWWLVGGGRSLPAWPATWLTRHKMLAISAAAAFTALPIVNDVFWFNQGMWLVPMLALLPVVRDVQWWAGPRPLYRIAAAGLISGFAWEAFNYPSLTGWHYLILQNTPHIFQMPLLGYAGFVPFALSILIVYEWQKQLVPHATTALILYGAGVAGVYALRVLYARHGLWLFQ